MDDALHDALIDYQKFKRISFHTPGHKGHNMLKGDIINFDVTELPLTDSLFEPSGCIKRAEEDMAKLYNTKRTLFSCGGNTLCIQTMIALAVGYGGKMLVGRNVHKSVVSAIALLDIEPVWIINAGDSGPGIPGRIHKEDVYKKLNSTNNIKAVFITSPDYYGVISDIKGISEVCSKFKIPLIVDNAHGSHFMFMNEGLHPLSLGAAMSADSVHKTMPVMTGGALLHINDTKYISNAKGYMGLFASTSPSYPIMASIDTCRKWLEGNGRRSYSYLEKRVSYIKKVIADMGILMPGGCVDSTRISLNVASIGYNGNEFKDYLYKYDIEPEYCSENYVVLISSPFNKESDWQALINAIKNVKVREGINTGLEYITVPDIKMSVREAVFSESETVNIDVAHNKVAAEIACPCPPGVPIVMPGELIGNYQKVMLRKYGISRIKVVK